MGALKKLRKYLSILVFMVACTGFLNTTGMEAHAADYTEPGTNIKYTYQMSNDGGSRIIIYKVALPNNYSSTHIKVPAAINGYAVVGIGQYSPASGAFAGLKTSNIKSIELPDGVCEIANNSFEGMSRLESISVNGNGIVIGMNAFNGCEKLDIVLRGSEPVRFISGYIFGDSSNRHMDFNTLKARSGNESWIGYQKGWNNESEWRNLVNSLTPFALSFDNNQMSDWEPDFEVLDANNGYPEKDQVRENSIKKDTYKAWIRKSAKWIDVDEEKALVRIDVAYNMMSSKQRNDMVFVLDVSGSMYYANNLIPGSNYSRQFQMFDNTRAVAKALLDLNEPGDIYNRVGVTTFGTNLRNTSLNGTGSLADKGFFSDYPSFIMWLDKITYYEDSSTGYAPGLEAAVSLFNLRSDKSRVPNVLFLSDGAPNAPSGGGNQLFPGSGLKGYGGDATRKLSDLGASRYSILLGSSSASTRSAVTLIAGKPGSSNDSSMMFDSPNAETLKTAFEEIVMQMSQNLALDMIDVAGDKFDVIGIPAVTGGSVSMSGSKTDWDMSSTKPCQEYTIQIVQNLKRNPDDKNAFYDGVIQTNLGDAELIDSALGTLVGVGSPSLNKYLPPIKIRVHVTNGYAIMEDGTENPKIEELAKKTSDYTARYRPNEGASLISIDVQALGGSKVSMDINTYKESLVIKDVRQEYDVYVVYGYPTPVDSWSLVAIVTNGTIQPAYKKDIPVGVEEAVTYEPDSSEFYLKEIILDETYKVPDPGSYSSGYILTGTAGQIRHIHVIYEKKTKTETEDKDQWADYRS